MFYFDDFYGKKILKSSFLPDLDCFFTTREFVLTPGSLSELKEKSDQNITFLKQRLNCEEIITAKQIHSDNIEIVKKNKYFYDNTDAIISNLPNSTLLMNFADCVPIILYSKKDNTGAVIHAGWRGTALNIALKTAKKMIDSFNISPNDIIAIIGPSIGKCCFETNEDVFLELIQDKKSNLVSHSDGVDESPSECSLFKVTTHKFRSRSLMRNLLGQQTKLYEKKGDKYFIDLKLLNYKQLVLAGITNIDICPYCTFCMSDIFFSYRKEKGITARHSAIVKIMAEW